MDIRCNIIQVTFIKYIHLCMHVWTTYISSNYIMCIYKGMYVLRYERTTHMYMMYTDKYYVLYTIHILCINIEQDLERSMYLVILLVVYSECIVRAEQVLVHLYYTIIYLLGIYYVHMYICTFFIVLTSFELIKLSTNAFQFDNNPHHNT